MRLTPASRYAPQQVDRHVVGVALDGDLGAVGQAARRRAARPAAPAAISDGVPPPTKTDVAGRQIGGAHLGAARVDVVVVQVVAIGPGREGAVVAPLRTERDVDVDAERGVGHGYARTETPSWSRRRRMIAGVVSNRKARARRSSRRMARRRDVKSFRFTWIMPT